MGTKEVSGAEVIRMMKRREERLRVATAVLQGVATKGVPDAMFPEATRRALALADELLLQVGEVADQGGAK
jgi:hypothetical protein